jgi:hypothetical protein
MPVSPPPNPTQQESDPPTRSLGDWLFWIAVILLSGVALLLGAIIVYNRWQQLQSPPEEIVIGAELRATAGILAGDMPLETTQRPPTALPTPPPTALPTITPTPSPTSPDSPVTPTEQGPEVTAGQVNNNSEFRDDFSSNALGWSEVQRDNSKRGYLPEAYFIEVTAPGVFALSFAPVNFIPEVVTFDAQVVAGEAGGTFGLLCQYVDEKNFYMVELNPFRGEIALGERLAGTYQALTSPEWQPASSFDTSPGTINHIQIGCTQELIDVRLNDTLVAAVEIAQPIREATQTALFAAGYPGLDAQGFKVSFDNFSALR